MKKNEAESLANHLRSVGRVVLTAKTKRQMGDMLVVSSDNGITNVINGGYHLGVEDGSKIPTTDFSRQQEQLPRGVKCLHNPKFLPDGSLDLR